MQNNEIENKWTVFFEMINKIHKPLATNIKKKNMKYQHENRKAIRTEPMIFKKIIREEYKQLYANKSGNNMNKYFEDIYKN